MRNTRVQSLVYISMFSIIIAICAWISIPTVVPFTLQTFGVFLAIGVLGGKKGTISILIYMLLGIVGIPVFSGFRSGIGVLLNNTGGYLVGFLISGLVIWGLEKLMGRKTWAIVVQMVVGLLICYIFGTIWFMCLYMQNTGKIEMMTVLGWCVFPFIIPDMIKIMLAFMIRKRIIKIMDVV